MKRRGFLTALLLAPFAKPVIQAAYTALRNYNPYGYTFRMISCPIIAHTRKLKTVWSVELDQELQFMYET
jgi:hypothetical protein